MGQNDISEGSIMNLDQLVIQLKQEAGRSRVEANMWTDPLEKGYHLGISSACYACARRIQEAMNKDKTDSEETLPRALTRRSAIKVPLPGRRSNG